MLSESSAAHTAFSSMSLVLTVMPCFSRTIVATAALAAEPSHGFTASVMVPLYFFAPLPPLVGVVSDDPDLLLLLHALSARASATVPMTSRRLRFMPSPFARELP